MFHAFVSLISYCPSIAARFSATLRWKMACLSITRRHRERYWMVESDCQCSCSDRLDSPTFVYDHLYRYVVHVFTKTVKVSNIPKIRVLTKTVFPPPINWKVSRLPSTTCIYMAMCFPRFPPTIYKAGCGRIKGIILSSAQKTNYKLIAIL